MLTQENIRPSRHKTLGRQEKNLWVFQKRVKKIPLIGRLLMTSIFDVSIFFLKLWD